MTGRAVCSFPGPPRWALLICCTAALLACTPGLNWREVAGLPEGDAGQQRWWFPCKPERIERQVTLQGQQVPALLAACDAQGITWSTMALQFPGPAEAAGAMAAARSTLMLNLQATEAAPPQRLLAVIPRGTSWWTARRAGGDAVTAAVRFQVQGRWLVQQVLMTQAGPAWPAALDATALNTFFEGAFSRP